LTASDGGTTRTSALERVEPLNLAGWLFLLLLRYVVGWRSDEALPVP
jgi:hypothetical protein